MVIFHAFFYLFFASLPFSSHDAVCLANVKEQFCHSAYKECAEVDGTFVPALLWFVQVHFCWILPGLYVQPFTTKITSCRVFFPVGSFCSRSECEKRKAIWDACVAEIEQDPGQKKDFDTQMLAVMDMTGRYIQTDWSVLFVWPPVSFLAYPKHWEHFICWGPPCYWVQMERGPLSDFWIAMCKEEMGIKWKVPMQL